MSKARERSGTSSKLAPPLAIEVNGERVVIDNSTMTIRERQTLRAALAQLPVEADQMDWTAGAVWIALRRQNPDLTFDEVLDSVTIGDVLDVERVEADPTDPEA